MTERQRARLLNERQAAFLHLSNTIDNLFGLLNTLEDLRDFIANTEGDVTIEPAPVPTTRS